MNTLDAIAARRSIRRFKPDPLTDGQIRAILTAAIQAPSGKNRQPWRFIVVREDKRAEMLRVMRTGIEKSKAAGIGPGSSEWTAQWMEQAPVTIFIFNPESKVAWLPPAVPQDPMHVVDTQSIGAAIQNMLLAAQDMGIGSLWICDVFYAYQDLSDWLGETSEMVAAVSFGYPDENPDARPRKSIDEVTKWL